jgi:predicted DNA-binding transcriptional regulator AlpA
MARMKRIEFIRAKRVCEITGLSKTELYRRVASGSFPSPRKYPDSNMNFWISADVENWQRQVIGCDDFEALLRTR